MKYKLERLGDHFALIETDPGVLLSVGSITDVVDVLLAVADSTETVEMTADALYEYRQGMQVIWQGNEGV